MAQGEFTKEETMHVDTCVLAIFDLLPKVKQGAVIGELNDILLYLKAAKEAAPDVARKPRAKRARTP